MWLCDDSCFLSFSLIFSRLLPPRPSFAVGDGDTLNTEWGGDGLNEGEGVIGRGRME